jgi:two-component system sensor histidine kinase KdpD
MLATAVMVSALTTQIKWQEQIRLEVEKEKTRANLLRAVSHDIRTPLTSIQASASGILDNYDALGRQEKVELLEGIRDESRWLIRMVENLLSITRINGDRAQLQTTWEVVEEVVGGAVGKFQKQFAQIEVETSMPEEVVMAPMDGILVEQVLVNLMENSAIHGKTTTKIRISVQKLPERVLFCVEDNGKGIDPAILPIIFEGQLPTGDHAASDGKRSMGIGLSVCMSIIQAHQGDMKAENMAAHRGARIQFWLPCQEENWMEEA